MNSRIADIRKDYRLQTLLEKNVDISPFVQFARWWNEAIESAIEEVNAMTLATSTADGAPSARIVLLKGFDERGFIFFTNYLSQKGKELSQNPNAALVFFWKELERQVRVEGTVEKLGENESDDYYNSRPRESRIGAWASAQSEKVAARDVIENNYQLFYDRYKDQNIARPPHWGGYIVKPFKMEFWQGRSSRLHDRILYSLQTASDWKIDRLSP